MEPMMVQKTSGIYQLTQIPALYAAFQRMLGGERARQELVASHIRPATGARVLDFGCGSGAILPYLGPVEYVGIDLNADHIAQARAVFGDRGTFYAGDFGSLPVEQHGTFDLVVCLGVLHHLDDARVHELVMMARRYLAADGRFVAVDPVFEPGQALIAHWLAKLDSGQCVRTAPQYAELVKGGFGNSTTTVRHDLLSLPYSHCITSANATTAGPRGPDVPAYS